MMYPFLKTSSSSSSSLSKAVSDYKKIHAKRVNEQRKASEAELKASQIQNDNSFINKVRNYQDSISMASHSSPYNNRVSPTMDVQSPLLQNQIHNKVMRDDRREQENMQSEEHNKQINDLHRVKNPSIFNNKQSPASTVNQKTASEFIKHAVIINRIKKIASGIENKTRVKHQIMGGAAATFAPDGGSFNRALDVVNKSTDMSDPESREIARGIYLDVNNPHKHHLINMLPDVINGATSMAGMNPIFTPAGESLAPVSEFKPSDPDAPRQSWQKSLQDIAGFRSRAQSLARYNVSQDTGVRGNW